MDTTPRVVLIADCCDESRAATAAALGGAAYVMTARDVDGALRWLSKVRPDAVLACITLPEGGIPALVARMRTDLEVADAPIIGVGEPDAQDEALVAGCAGFVARPVDPVRLLALMERAVG